MKYLDMLAKLGVGNAHPGGYASTLEQLEAFPCQPGDRILEVGCGTGRTACLLASMGASVTGVDIRPEMIAKAKKRAQHEGVEVDFQVGDATKLPFADRQFDTVMAESVTIFAGSKCFKEYERVLKPGGVLYDREMMLVLPLDKSVYNEICGFYGVPEVPSPEEWLSRIRSCFPSASMWNAKAFGQAMTEQEFGHPDIAQETDEGALTDPQLWSVAGTYDRLMHEYGKHFGFALFIGRKANKNQG